ncbi:MAG TPA: hypothetical protein VIU10_05250 [Candidatus Udaeobacter sp.]
MAPTINMTKPVATAIATFVSIDKFTIFAFIMVAPPVAPFFWILRISSNFGVLMDARRRRRKKYEVGIKNCEHGTD